MKFSCLASYFQKLASTASRNEMTIILAKLLKEADQEEIDKVCYLALGKLGPKFRVIEFNLAEKMMIQALAQAFNVSLEEVKKLFKKLGDLGDSAAVLKLKTKNAKLSINEAYQRLREIAEESGAGSVERKIKKMARLLAELDGLSAKYAVRIVLANLRLGFSDMTILDALSWLAAGDKSQRPEIEAAYNVRADIGEIAKKLKAQSSRQRRGSPKAAKLKAKTQNLKLKQLTDFLGKIKPQIGTPVMPALCQRLPNAEEMVEKMGTVAVEPKYDGQRLQIHYRATDVPVEVHFGSVRSVRSVQIFTRNLDNVTQMFPDIVKALDQEVKALTAILDGEIVGIDPKTGNFLPFQETIKRKRKYQVQLMIAAIPLQFFCFDVLYFNGRDLLAKPFSQRRQILEKILSSRNRIIKLTPQIVTSDPKKIRLYHDEQIKKGLEGVVLKKREAAYDPGRRGYTWVKFKSEKKGKRGGGLADTLDCLVMGYYFGKGKRTGFGIGAFLVGVSRGHQFLTVSKIGTGLSDEQWRELKVKSQKSKVKNKPKNYLVDKNLAPDVWLKPELVVEIEADNITQSPIHSAGYALRFPRLIRFRDDKSQEQTTSLQELKKLYKIQQL